MDSPLKATYSNASVVYRLHWRANLTRSAVYATIWLVFAGLFFLLPFSVLIVFPLLLVPSWFVLETLVFAYWEGKEPHPGLAGIGQIWSGYYKAQLGQAFRPIWGVVKALFFAVVLTVVIGIAYSVIGSNVDPEFNARFAELSAYSSMGNVDGLLELMESDPKISTYFRWLTISLFGWFVFFYIDHIQKRTLFSIVAIEIPSLNERVPGVPRTFTEESYRVYRFDLWKQLAPLALCEFVIFGGIFGLSGYLGHLFAWNDRMTSALAMGLCALPFGFGLPYALGILREIGFNFYGLMVYGLTHDTKDEEEAKAQLPPDQAALYLEKKQALIEILRFRATRRPFDEPNEKK